MLVYNRKGIIFRPGAAARYTCRNSYYSRGFFMATMERFRGIVAEFSIGDGAGVILLSDGREVAVRYSSIRGEGVRRLEKGTAVTCLLEETRKGLYAVCVQPE
jgi:cold shock CspA family protein